MPGKIIRKYRESLGYTQEYMATHMGISQNAYSKIENNITQLTVEHLKQISAALGVAITDLLKDEFEIYRPVNMQVESVPKDHLLLALKELRKKLEERNPDKHDFYPVLMSILNTAGSTMNGIL